MADRPLDRPAMENFNPLTDDYPADTLNACANSISFLRQYFSKPKWPLGTQAV
jgi:hypothetical protein